MIDRFVVFDRDGTLIDYVHHLIDINYVKVKIDAMQALTRLKNYGFKFGVITNQSVIGRGLAPLSQIEGINSYISKLFLSNDIFFEFFWMCPHVPEEVCACRKPNIELGKKAISKFKLLPEENYYVGDQETDMQFSRNIGFVPVMVNEFQKRSELAAYSTNSLLDAVDWIIKDSTKKRVV
jgi:histidinol-phosphate phosphatase family protein